MSEALAAGTIEALTPVAGKNTCTVQVDGDSFEVAQSVVEALGLTPGAVLSAEQRQTLETAAHKRAAAAVALRYLSGRPRTAREVVRHLVDKGHARDTAHAVLEDLRSGGLVDDARFAAWYVEARLSHRPTGSVRLVQEMVERGVSRTQAEAAVGDHSDTESEWARARQAAHNRMSSLRGLPDDRAKRRLAGFLSGRGFPMEIVRHLCLEEWESLRGEDVPPAND